MNFKIDTKEKFTVITPLLDFFDANIAASLWETATLHLEQAPNNVIINFKNIKKVNADSVNDLLSLQQKFYSNQASFVVCNVSDALMPVFENEDLPDVLNITPTESEAWDIVQMDEIERELLDDNEVKEEGNG